MQSLALMAAVVILSLLAVAGAAVGTALFGLRTAAIVSGVLAIAAGAWLLATLPHVPSLGLVVGACGVFALWRASR